MFAYSTSPPNVNSNSCSPSADNDGWITTVSLFVKAPCALIIELIASESNVVTILYDSSKLVSPVLGIVKISAKA